MQLRQIKDERCKVCGCKAVLETSGRKHVNGQYFETREYSCGAVVKWVPNFSRLEQPKKCPMDPIILRDRAKQKTAYEKLIKYINRLNVDDEWKLQAETHIRFLRNYGKL